jgi:hypothetical protein
MPREDPTPRPAGKAKGAAAEAPPPSGARGRSWMVAAVVSLVLVGFASGFNHVWNFDIHWHLASGQWMLQHRTVLDHDPFSIDPPPHWHNGHWLFQVIVAAIHAVGGWAPLTVLKAALAAAAMLGFALALRRRAPAGWLILCGLLMLDVMQGRIRVRPEAFSLAFLTFTIVLADGVRLGGSPRRLWWLAPILLLWANIQGLFMLGVAVVGSTLLGALVDRRCRKSVAIGGLLSRRAIAPVALAVAACLITPWPLETIANPFVLARRISGQEYYYTYVVTELQPTYEVLSLHPEAITLVVATTVVILANLRAVPLAHLSWLGAFVLLGLLARRNVALLGPVCGYLLALHGGEVLRRMAARAPRLGRAGPFVAAVAVLLAAAVTFGYATEWVFRVRHTSQRFGAGVQKDNYPVHVARWLCEDLKNAGGDIFCDNFGDAAVFIYYGGPRDRPVRKVFIDGRNEFHRVERFIQQETIRGELRTKDGAEMVELPPAVRFLFIRFDSLEQLAGLSQNPRRYRLVRVSDIGACFARLDWPGTAREGPLENIPDRSNIDELDRPLGADGLLVGLPADSRRWFRQNPPPMIHRMGSMLLAMGRQNWDRGKPASDPLKEQCLLMSIRYLSAARKEDLAPRHLTLGGLAMAYQQRYFQSPDPPPGAPIDINSARSLWLFEQLGTGNMEDLNMQGFALERVGAFFLARQLDSAEWAMRLLLENLPPKQRVHPPDQYTDLRNQIRKALRQSYALVANRGVRLLPPVQQAKEFTAQDVGLIGPAIAALRSAPQDDAEAQLMLGDLLLRRGWAAEARQVFARASLLPGDGWKLKLRAALCDWAEGRLFEARDALRALSASSGEPILRYYQDELRKQIGQ